MKIVINAAYGGFGTTSDMDTYLQNRGYTMDQINELNDWGTKFTTPLRTDETLIECVEFFKNEGRYGMEDFKILEIPDDTDWRILEHDGWESVVDRRYFWY